MQTRTDRSPVSSHRKHWSDTPARPESKASASAAGHTGLTDAHAVIARADTRNDAYEHMLCQPVRLRIFLINIYLSAVDGGIYVRVAVDADEAIRRPPFASRTRSARLVALLVPRDFLEVRSAAPQTAGLPAEDRPDTRRPRRSHLARAVRCLPRRCSDRTDCVLIDKNLDRQSITSSCQPMRRCSEASVLDGQHTPCYPVRKEGWDQYEIIYQTKGILLGGSVYRF